MDNATTFKTVLGMMDLNVNDKMSFILLTVCKKFIEKDMEFDLVDISKIKVLVEKLYD